VRLGLGWNPASAGEHRALPFLIHMLPTSWPVMAARFWSHGQRRPPHRRPSTPTKDVGIAVGPGPGPQALGSRRHPSASAVSWRPSIEGVGAGGARLLRPSPPQLRPGLIPASGVGHLRHRAWSRSSSWRCVNKTPASPAHSRPASPASTPTTRSRACFKAFAKGPKAGGGRSTPARAGKVAQQQGTAGGRPGGRPAT